MKKKILVHIDKEWFEYQDEIEGVYDQENDVIIVKEADGFLILHELVHAVEKDPKTRKAVTELYDIGFVKKNRDFDKICEDYFPGLSKEDAESEFYAECIERRLQGEFDSSEMAIGYFLGFVKGITGISIELAYLTSHPSQINIR